MTLDSSSNLFKYWGKAKPQINGAAAYHPLVYHSLDVAAVGLRLLEKDSVFQKKFVFLSGVSREEFLAICPFFLALHDLGKFADGFQNIKPELFELLHGKSSTAQYSVRHDSMGYFIWAWLLADQSKERGWLPRIYDERQWDYWIQAVTGHHGKPPELPETRRLGKYVGPTIQKDIEDFTNEISNLFLSNYDFSSFEKLDFNFEKFSWPLAGFAVLCDWLGSNSDVFQYKTEQIPLKNYFDEFALPRAERILVDSGILSDKAKYFENAKNLFPYLKKISPLQDFVESCSIGEGPQLFILEDATGSGKTEAALILASRLIEIKKASGLYFALPTMATANSIYARLSSIYQNFYEDNKKPSLLLAHSSRHLSKLFRNSVRRQPTDDKYGNEETASIYCNAWLADSRKKALLANVGVGTIDQALMAALPSKHQSLRLLGLMRNVLIVDEVHSYDPYTNELLSSLLRFHAAQGGSAILLSATLPQDRKNELAGRFRDGLGKPKLELKETQYPLAIRVDSETKEETALQFDFRSKKHAQVKWVRSLEQAESVLLDASAGGACSCWIRNTVDDAIESYIRLQKKVSEENIILFHARFAMGDRLAIESEIIKMFGPESGSKDRAGKILIATQIVEQSLDLDFDVMVSDLAPIDLLIQRCGRLRRHVRDTNGNRIAGASDQRGESILIVHGPEPFDNVHAKWYRDFFPRGSYVYPSHGQLWLTAKLLQEKEAICIPEDARELIEGVYGKKTETQIPASLLEIDDKAFGKSWADKSLARFNVLNLEAGYVHDHLLWMDETQTPTRLSLPVNVLRLARWNGYTLTPWLLKDKEEWALSEIRVRTFYANEEPKHKDPSLIKAIKEAKETMTDQCKWCLFTPMSSGSSGAWTGEVVNEKGETVLFTYSKNLGLQFIKPDVSEEP